MSQLDTPGVLYAGAPDHAAENEQRRWCEDCERYPASVVIVVGGPPTLCLMCAQQALGE